MAYRPYLFFGGNCREAFTRYQEIFGGELTLLPMKDAPGQEDAPPETADMIIHAALVNGDDVLMASDDPTSVGTFGPVQGIMVSYDAADDDEAKRVFEALAEGGTVTQALEPTFFATAFGMCTDRFGTPWMVVGPDPNAG
jgi:PhnB protein